ncbi:MAG: hypothetical protein H0X37_02570 [Herpetosiphonaceae bacterium]|nr:hypothetical protein [Herpetosiphonaceae bacterium]
MRRSLFIPAFAAVLLVATVVVGRATDHPMPMTANAVVALPTPTRLPSSPAVAVTLRPATPTPTPKPAEPFLVRTWGAHDRLIAYNPADRQPQWTLPLGIPSADGKHYYTASSGNDATVVDHFDLRTGARTGQFTVFDNWAVSGVSYQGRWLAMTRIMNADEQRAWSLGTHWQTDILVVEATSGFVVHRLRLEGNFDVETISGSGDALFLIQHLPAIHPDHYVIRLYDLTHDMLQADPLRAKGSDEIMAGLAWDGLASSDGRWLLTLYLSTKRDTAFVHTLDLVNHLPVCIDLPSGTGNFDLLKNYTLALTPNNQTLFAANATLGVVAEINMESRQVVRTVKFPAHPTAPSTSGIPESHSVLSKDGHSLYFTNGHTLWDYTIGSDMVRELPVHTARIIGLGLSSDDQHLFLVDMDEAMTILDTPKQGLWYSPENVASADAQHVTSTMSSIPTTQLSTSTVACPVTRPPNPPFVPPPPYLSSPPSLDPHDFWYGTGELWTNLPKDDVWGQLPHEDAGFTQKVFWYQDFDKPESGLTVTGRRLDAAAPPLLVSPTIDGGGFLGATLTGVDFPTLGCWEITGHLKGHDLRFVVEVAP